MSGAEHIETLDRDVSVETFAARNAAYFAEIFERLQKGKLPRWHLNLWGVVVPWGWAAWRGVWLMFWLALAIDVLAVVCLMQVVKFSPLLADALQDPDANRTLIPRYTGWIDTYTRIGIVLLIAGRLWMGSQANRWYYKQYQRWRINHDVANGVNTRRLILGLVIMAICAPLTIYRATEQRLDERACLGQVRMGETVEDLLRARGTTDIGVLNTELSAEVAVLQAQFDALDALESPTSEQKSQRSAARKLLRDKTREAETVTNLQAITAKNRFDCMFIDDFPTLARFDAPAEVRYRRVPDEDARAAGDEDATKVIIQQGKPIEGRRINIFTYNAEAIDTGINYLRAQHAGIFDAMTHVLRQSLIRVEVAFMQTPWPVVAFLFLALAGRV